MTTKEKEKQNFGVDQKIVPSSSSTTNAVKFRFLQKNVFLVILKIIFSEIIKKQHFCHIKLSTKLTSVFLFSSVYRSISRMKKKKGNTRRIRKHIPYFVFWQIAFFLSINRSLQWNERKKIHKIKTEYNLWGDKWLNNATQIQWIIRSNFIERKTTHIFVYIKVK